MLRDFWFQIFLFLAGLAAGMPAGYSHGNARRAWWTVSVVLIGLSILSYIWGDPVRGPFANLIHPKAREQFTVHAGISVPFPITQLKDGIDFSRVMNIPNRPVDLWLQKTWWSGWRFRVLIKGEGNNPVVSFNEREVLYVASGFDLNFDESAIEVVQSNKLPVFQVIIADDYDVYVNAVMANETTATILKDNLLALKPVKEVKPSDFPERLFKYPSYANPGRRD